MTSLFSVKPRVLLRDTPPINPSNDGRIGLFFLRFMRGCAGPDLNQMARRIILPSLPVADEDMARLTMWEAGRRMARQEEWEELDQLISYSEAERLATPGGAGEAWLLIDGAQSDVSAAAIHALEDGQMPDMSGIATLERIAEDYAESHAIAMVVAQAHLRIGLAWLQAPELTASQHTRHFKRAQALLARFDAKALDAPALAAMEAKLAELLAPDAAGMIAAYRRLLALDPCNFQYLRAFGLACLDAQTDELPLLAQQSAQLPEQTEALWGQGGYVWLYLDALKQCDEALGTLDVERFITGLRDILRRGPNQHLVNELAAFCALTMSPDRTRKPRSAEKARARLHACLGWILSDHLQELHPALWQNADTLPGNAPQQAPPRAQLARGRNAALRVIARQFADQLADGSSIAFSPAGMYRLPAI